MSAPTRNQPPLTEPHPSGSFPVINPEKRKASKKAVAIGAGLLVSAGVTFGIVEALTPSENDKATSIDSGATPTVERPADMTADNASSVDFYNDNYFSNKERIDWANEQLQQNANDPEYPGLTVEQAAYERVKVQLKEDSEVDLGPLVTPSELNDANEADIQILTVDAAALYEVDLNKAKKILAASMRQDTDFYESFVEDLEEIHSTNPTKEDLVTKTIGFAYTPTNYNANNELVPVATETTTNGSIGNIQAFEGSPTRVAYMTETQVNNDVPSFEAVQAFIDNRWVTVQKIEPTDTDLWIPPSNLITLSTK